MQELHLPHSLKRTYYGSYIIGLAAAGVSQKGIGPSGPWTGPPRLLLLLSIETEILSLEIRLSGFGKV